MKTEKEKGMDEDFIRTRYYFSKTSSPSLEILDGFPTLELEICRQGWVDVLEKHRANVGGCAKSLMEGAVDCLNEGDPTLKAVKTLVYAEKYFGNELTTVDDDVEVKPPDVPKRDVETVDPRKVPRRGNNVLKLIHSLAHIESVAIDLSWDMVARFGRNRPKEFLDDWVEVANDEARHFLLWQNRLHELGSYYGSLPTHSGLWDSAQRTSDNILHRLAIEHMVLEARGLDVAPSSFAKFQSSPKDQMILQAIYAEEISHVAKGVKWFENLATGNPKDRFHEIVASHLVGKIKPPFNHTARSLAGMSLEYYHQN